MLQSFNPDLFIWTGDSVYASKNDVASLEKAYMNLTANEYYQRFKENVPIMGTWDDHDYGINDGGKYVDHIHERQKLFRKYILGDDANNLRSSDSDNDNDMKLYTTINNIFYPSGATVKFIILDTRSYRDNHYIRSLGEFKLPLFPIIAALIRTTYTILGFGRNYIGDILGKKQWLWLENELKTTTSDFNIIVSSIQVLTSNPVVESWGHFPIAKKKLLSLIVEYNPRGIAFLSGDVHHAEISQAILTRQKHIFTREDNYASDVSNSTRNEEDVISHKPFQEDGGVYLHTNQLLDRSVKKNNKHNDVYNKEEEEEIYITESLIDMTSSGMTHSCGDSRIHR